MSINRLSDPAVVGPGTWWYIHIKARDATTGKKIDEFIDHMYFLAKNFSCTNCRKHINQYIDTHPFKDLKHLKNKDGERIGMFKWAWMFHNAVNTRIHKSYVEWETAVEMFYDDSIVCDKNCGEDSENNEVPKYKPRKQLDKLAQSYFMHIGIPNTLRGNGVMMDSESMVSYIQN